MSRYISGDVQEGGWRRSGYCATANCLQVAPLDNGVGVRDSKSSAGPILRFSRDEFTAFILGAKAGHFDDLCSQESNG